MRMIWTLIALMMLGLGVSGQATSKSDKKLAKEQAKSEKQRIEADLRRATVSLQPLMTFPSDYLDRSLRVADVTLDEIKPYSEGAMTAFVMGISSGSSSTLGVPLTGHVTFLMEKELARATLSEVGEISDYYKRVIDVWFRMKTVDHPRGPYYIAVVDCIVFKVSGRGQSTVIGSCQR